MGNIINSLFVIAVYDNELINLYPIVAADYEKASKMAITKCMEERLEEHINNDEPTVDYDLSFELTCAPNQDGIMMDISLH